MMAFGWRRAVFARRSRILHTSLKVFLRFGGDFGALTGRKGVQGFPDDVDLGVGEVLELR